MTPTTVEIIKAIAEHLGLNPEDLELGASLKDELNLGPIELNDLISFLSQKFNVTFEPEDIGNAPKIEDLVNLVEDNLLG